MPWILNEHAALKQKLQGITVTDATSDPSGTPVNVIFRVPETELTNQTWPMIVIDNPMIMKASDREHRGRVTLPYFPEGMTQADAPNLNLDVDVHANNPFISDWPIPYDFIFNVTAYARLQNHQTEILSQLMSIDYLPHRFGWISVPQDGTTRSLFVTAGPELSPARDSDDKRIFTIHYAVTIPGELTTFTASQLSQQYPIQSISITEREFDPANPPNGLYPLEPNN